MQFYFNAGNYRDQFGSSSYSNSNGSVPWTTNWTETNDRASNDPQANGEIRINNGALEFRQDTGTGSTPAGATITRGIDLSMVGSGTATLSFSYVEANLDAGETLQVRYAADGVNFTTLQTLNNNSNFGSSNLALTGPFTANAKIQFVFSGVNANNETVRIDNVNVAFKAPSNDGSNDWSATFTEPGTAANGTPVAISDLSGISNADTLSSAKVVLTNAKAGDGLTASGLPAGITATTTNVAGVITLTLNGIASAAAYQQAIDAVRYSTTSQAPDTTDRHIEVTVNNGIADSNAAISTIHVISTDDPMVANDDRVVTNYAANTAFTVKVADLLANDTDGDGVVAIASINSHNGLASLPVLNNVAGTVSVTDNAVANGSFVYQGTSPDTATVTVTRDNAGTLDGTSNAEIIIGDGASTTIVGSGGRDVIYGGAGNDTFDYNSLGILGFGSDVDTVGTVTGANVGQLEVIMDWNVGDKIDLATIDAKSSTLFTNDTFTFLGESATFTAGNANGGVHFFYVTDANNHEFTVVEASNDGDTAAEFQVALVGHVNLTAGSFTL